MNFFLWLEWLIRFGALALFSLCLAKYRADCPMNEICCDSDIFTIYQNETGFVKRSNLYASTQTFPRKCSITTRISKVE